MKRKVTEDQVNQFVQLYNNGQSAIQLAKQFKLDLSTITYWLKKENVYLRNKSERNTKYTLDKYYFEKINTEQKAYFLGLIASDGCVTDRNKILISLVESDGYLIEAFKKAINYNGPLIQIN